jgi:hypothetical protein
VLALWIYQDLLWRVKALVFGTLLRRALNSSRQASSGFVTVVLMPCFGRTLGMDTLPSFQVFPSSRLFVTFLLMPDGLRWSTSRQSSRWVRWRWLAGKTPRYGQREALKRTGIFFLKLWKVDFVALFGSVMFWPGVLARLASSLCPKGMLFLTKIGLVQVRWIGGRRCGITLRGQNVISSYGCWFKTDVSPGRIFANEVFRDPLSASFVWVMRKVLLTYFLAVLIRERYGIDGGRLGDRVVLIDHL